MLLLTSLRARKQPQRPESMRLRRCPLPSGDDDVRYRRRRCPLPPACAAGPSSGVATHGAPDQRLWRGLVLVLLSPLWRGCLDLGTTAPSTLPKRPTRNFWRQDNDRPRRHRARGGCGSAYPCVPGEEAVLHDGFNMPPLRPVRAARRQVFIAQLKPLEQRRRRCPLRATTMSATGDEERRPRRC